MLPGWPLRTLRTVARSELWRASHGPVAWTWGLSLAVILTGGMVFADFCIIDDWLVTRFLAPGDGLPFSRIWPALLETEVGGIGAAGRFRPIFFLHLELETWLFGDQPSLYRVLRVVYFGLFLGAAAVWTGQRRWRKAAHLRSKEAALWKREAETLKAGFNANAGGAPAATPQIRSYL